jgi:hypothetical protein
VKYIVVIGESPTELVQFVNARLAEGFTPLGGICRGATSYLQAMWVPPAPIKPQAAEGT